MKVLDLLKALELLQDSHLLCTENSGSISIKYNHSFILNITNVQPKQAQQSAYGVYTLTIQLQIKITNLNNTEVPPVQMTIADTIHLFEELLTTLDYAYWESASIERKDTFFDIISIFQLELRELAKLSVEDHYLTYEPICVGARNVQPKLQRIHSQLDSWAMRSTTTSNLRQQLPQVSNVLTRET